jgi:hypothetical protein
MSYVDCMEYVCVEIYIPTRQQSSPKIWSYILLRLEISDPLYLVWMNLDIF